MQLIPSAEDRGSLLVLPSQGWCHHGVETATPLATGRPEGLLRLSDHHAGGVLYIGRKTAGRAALVVVADDGSDAIVQGLDWALAASVWKKPQLVVLSQDGAAARKAIFEELADRHEASGTLQWRQAAGTARLPDDLGQADALVTTALPNPKRADWYGMSWHERIGTGWTGDVLVVPSEAKQR